MAYLFLDTLQRYRAQKKFLLHEFVLMPDHTHLLFTPAGEISLEKAVQLVKGGFSFRVKKELGSNLEIWERGYPEHRVKNSTDYQRHTEYIWQNPARAALAETADAYPCGSAFRKSDIDPIPPWLKPTLGMAISSPR